jgi:dimethylglycine dehydrogenase
VQWQQKGFDNAFVTLEVHGVTNADPLGNNPIYRDGKLVGRATSGNYGPRTDRSYALAVVQPGCDELGTELEMNILGDMHKVTVIPESPFDPENERLRA